MSTQPETVRRSPSPSTVPPPSLTATTGHRLSGLIINYGLVLLLVVVVAVFSLLPQTSAVYLTQANLTTLVGNQAVVCIVALAALVPLTAGYIDLSAGAVTGVSSLAVAGSVSTHGSPAWLGILIGVLAGTLLGAINGYLVAYWRLSSIITTLGTNTALSGLMLWYTKGAIIGSHLPTGFVNFGALNWAGIPRVTVVMVPIVVAAWFILENVPFGRRLQAIASSPGAARLVGIDVRRHVFLAFVSAGLLAGLAGVLLCARSGAADSTTGPSYLFPALAAVFLGATTIRPGRPNVAGCVVGIFFVAFIVSGLSLLGAGTWAPNLFNGLILVIAAGFAMVFARRRGGGPSLF